MSVKLCVFVILFFGKILRLYVPTSYWILIFHKMMIQNVVREEALCYAVIL